MPKVTFIEHDGTQLLVDGTNGDSLMQTAVNNDVDGILGDCGGSCACATCHCYVDQTWLAHTGNAEGMEAELLEMASSPAQENSRLACQIVLTDDLDGLVVRLPELQ